VYKITTLPPELDRIIISYLVRSKFNNLRRKLRDMYGKRKYYMIGYDEKNNNVFKEISFKKMLIFDDNSPIFDELSMKYYCNLCYEIDSDEHWRHHSLSFRGIIMKIYNLIYDGRKIDGCIRISDGKFTISRSELLKMKITSLAIIKNE
jgi:hypothetical protein